MEFFSPSQDNYITKVEELYNEDMFPIQVANHPMEILYLKVEQVLNKDDLARKVTK